MSGSEDWLSRARGMSPAEATEQGISGAILAVFGGIIMMIEALFQGLSRLMEVLGDLREFIGAFFTAPIEILTETASYVAFTLTEGDWAFFGPGTFAVGVLSIVLAWWVWTLFDPDIPFIDNLIPWR